MISNFYIPQDPGFKGAIHSIWQVEGHPAFQEEHIIPKGVVEIIFNFSNRSSLIAEIGSKQYGLSNCFINGFNTRPIQLQLPERQLFFGVVFQPLAIKRIFKIPAGEFSDITVDISLLDKNFHSLWHQLAEQDNFDNRVATFLRWLNKNLIDWQPQELLINNFLYAGNNHAITVSKLAGSLCYSPRHLSRKLLEATGMNAEELLQYKKYLYAVDLMQHTDLLLTEIAHQSYFSDQSHFIKTFKAYTGITPGAYKRNRSAVKGHLFANVR